MHGSGRPRWVVERTLACSSSWVPKPIRPAPVSSLVTTEDRLRRPVPPRAVEQAFQPGVERGQVGVPPEQGIATGQFLTVAEGKLGGHVGRVGRVEARQQLISC